MSYDYISSLPAYKGNKQGKDYCRSMVFLTIKKLGIANDREIKSHLGWEKNSVVPRRNELVEKQLVVMAYKKLDPHTNRTVSYWEVKKINYEPKMF